LSVPGAYLPLLEDIRLLKSDEQNPNKTTVKQREQIWKSLQKYGWTYPIICNKDGVFADGEQRGWHWAMTGFALDAFGAIDVEEISVAAGTSLKSDEERV
jgi:hypothetical protein